MSQGAWGAYPYDGGARLTWAVRALLIAMGAAYVVQVLLGVVDDGLFTRLFGLNLWRLRHGFVWQPVTYLFVHGGLIHLLLNMLGLFFMGPETERAMGSRHFMILFFVSGILGGVGWLLISNASWPTCVGASGAIFGVIGAFTALFPNRPVTVLIFYVVPVTMRAWVMAMALGVMELAFLLGSGFDGGIAYAAHLAGGVAGYVYTAVLFRQSGASWRSFVRAPRWGQGSPAADSPEIDRLLDKVSREGIGSLTARERRVLEKASQELNSRSP